MWILVLAGMMVSDEDDIQAGPSSSWRAQQSKPGRHTIQQWITSLLAVTDQSHIAMLSEGAVCASGTDC